MYVHASTGQHCQRSWIFLVEECHGGCGHPTVNDSEFLMNREVSCAVKCAGCKRVTVYDLGFWFARLFFFNFDFSLGKVHIKTERPLFINCS